MSKKLVKCPTHPEETETWLKDGVLYCAECEWQDPEAISYSDTGYTNPEIKTLGVDYP